MNALKKIKFILLLLLLTFFTTTLTGCQSQQDIRSDVLLDNLISEDGDGFVFEQIPWGKTKQDLIDEKHIPSKGTTENDIEALTLDEKVHFTSPDSDAMVIYQFQDGLFIGGDYYLQAEDEDDLVRIAGELMEQLSEELGEPDGNTLDELLSEEAIRSESDIGNLQYTGEDFNDINIGIWRTETDLAIHIKTRGPHSLLEKLHNEMTE